MLSGRMVYEARAAFEQRLRMAFDRGADVREWSDVLTHSLRLISPLSTDDAVWWAMHVQADPLSDDGDDSPYEEIKQRQISDVIAALWLLDDLLFQLSSAIKTLSTEASP